MKIIQEVIQRENSVITGKSTHMEILGVFKDFPIFFGCVDHDENEDQCLDQIWAIDKETGIIQLQKLVPQEILYKEQHMDATGKAWELYNSSFSDFVVNNSTGNILEIGSGSGKLAKLISKRIKKTFYAIEPNPLFKSENNLIVVKDFFNPSLKSKFEVSTVIFSQLYEHVYDPIEFLKEIYGYLDLDGKLIFGYPDLEFMFKNKYTNAINFEHSMLMTDYYVDIFLEHVGFKIDKKQKFQNHFFYSTTKIKNDNNPIKVKNRYAFYKKMFNDFVSYHKDEVLEINNRIKSHNGEIFLFGAHIFSQFLLQFGVDASKINGILDNSPIKIGRRLYGSSLMVHSPSVLRNSKNPMVILKAGQFNNEIKSDIITNHNGQCLFI